jgi:hypothetical protein
MASDDKEAMSRKGYSVKDLARNFVQVLGETGPEATGKLLHYTADFICSGGYELWSRLCWDYAFDHIGLSSPRVFVYLKQKIGLLSEMAMKFTANRFMTSVEVQKATVEIVLILQTCPKRAKVKWPVVPQDTHKNEEWLAKTALSTERACVKKVWNHSVDLPPLFYAANEMVNAITDGAIEKALFWTRWIIEEDSMLRKVYGAGLSSMERGPATVGSKVRTHPGYFLCAVLAEAYKELVEKGQVRMHEEFQTLLDIYRSSEKSVNAKRKQDALILMIQILTEVPRWKVPAAPTLVKDTVVLGRAVDQAPIFYTEILRLPLPDKPLPNKVGSIAPKKIKDTTKLDRITGHLDEADKAIMDFFGGGF